MYSLQKQAELKKEEITRITMQVWLNENEVFYFMISETGEARRKGSGNSEGSHYTIRTTNRRDWFETLRQWLDKRMLTYPGSYFDSNPAGTPVEYCIRFERKKEGETLFRFHTGMDSAFVRQLLLLPYFDTFVCKAMRLTDTWYQSCFPEQHYAGSFFFPEPALSPTPESARPVMSDCMPRWWQKHL